MSNEDNYYSEFRKITSKIDGKLHISELSEIYMQLFQLTKGACEFSTESFRPNRDWDEKAGKLSRELKFLREEVKVIVDFYNSNSKPDTFSKSESVHCIQGSQPGDAVRYNDNVEIGHIEICFPIEGHVEKKENGKIREMGYSDTGFIDLNDMRFSDKQLKKAVLKKFSSENYPDKTILIVNFGPTDHFDLISQKLNDTQSVAYNKFTETVEWMKTEESNFSEVYAMYRWEPHLILRTK